MRKGSKNTGEVQEKIYLHYSLLPLHFSRIMPLVRSLDIFMLAIKVLDAYGSKMHVTHRLTAAKALALLTETEDFITHREAYYKNPGDLERMIQLRDTLLVEFTSDFEKRKAIRPLLDCIDRAKRIGNSK